MKQKYPLFLPSTKTSCLTGKIPVEKLHKQNVQSTSISPEKFLKRSILKKKSAEENGEKNASFDVCLIV